MEPYFAIDYPGSAFQLFGPAHLSAIGLAAAAGALLIRQGRLTDDAGRRRLRSAFALLLLVNEVSLHVWRLSHGIWSVTVDLPFQMCGGMIWVTAFVFLFDARRLFPMVYFFGIAGAMQGVLTPDAGEYGLPHYLALETLFSHSSLVIAGLWVALVEGFRPTLRHFWIIFGGLNLAALIMYFVNAALGSNYLFVNAKPPNASVVDLLPAWPGYIPYLEIIAFVLFFLLYLPFAPWRTLASTLVPSRIGRAKK